MKIESPFLLTWTGFFLVMGLLALLLLATLHVESGLPNVIFAVAWVFYVASFSPRRARLKRKIYETRKQAMKEPSSN